jgi:hypothetical protein
VASLFQRFFGPEMDRRHLPAAWSSTASSLELVGSDKWVAVDSDREHMDCGHRSRRAE